MLLARLRLGQADLGKLGVGIGAPGDMVGAAFDGSPNSIDRITTPA